MMMPTVYQLNLIKRYFIVSIVGIVIILLTGNVISFFCTKRIYVNENAYILKEGFPLFKNEKDYIEFVRNYPYDPGVKLEIHKVGPDDTLWGIKKQYNISLQTLISANPHLKNFEIIPGTTIVIPLKNGTLLTFDNYFDVGRMAELIRAKKITGDYRPGIFSIVSPDDMRMVFFEDTYPV